MLRSTARALVIMLRRLLEMTLAAIMLGLLARFTLTYPHPAKWDAWWLVVQIRRHGDPLLGQLASWFDLSWPSGSARFLPLVLVAAAWILRGLVTTRLARLAHWLARPSAAEAAAAGPSFAPLIAKAVIQDQLERTQPVAPPAPARPPTETLPPPPPARTVMEPVPPAAPPAPAAPPLAARARPGPSQTPTLVPQLSPTVIDRPESLVETGSGTMARLGETAPRARPAAKVERIGRYQILEELGRGGMGVVYKARDPQIGRTVAIKTIVAAALADESAEHYKRRLYVEARAAGKLGHPGIVTMHDITEDEEGQPCLVMEFIEGTTLEKLVGAERLPLEQILDVVIQVARAVDYAHGRGVVHRDIKPANVIVTADGRAKIMDFGIAKLAGTQLTATGQLVGTPAFMSPEQFMGSAVDARSDIFSLGSVLYWLCTGEKPFPGETITAIAYNVVQVPPVPMRQLNPALPAELDAIIIRCLAKSPAERYASGRELAAALEEFRTRRSQTSTSSADATLVDGSEE